MIARILSFLLILTLCISQPTSADDGANKGTVPETVETAIGAILAANGCTFDSVRPTGDIPDPAILGTIMAYSDDAATGRIKGKILLRKRPYGAGAFTQTTIHLPMRRLLEYLGNPEIPASAIHPTTVRRNKWKNVGNLPTQWEKTLTLPFPPKSPIILRGVEYEETTPDETSGCTYSYDLHRLLILTAYKGRTTLISVSHMPAESELGRMGVLVGDDTWSYVYTNKVGTNLMLAGWAKTAIYASEGVSVLMENPDGASVTWTAYKYTRAGWSGMNMVKAHHIATGTERFFKGTKRVLEDPRFPSPSALAAMARELDALDDASLRQIVAPFAESLKKADVKYVRKKPYSTVLETYVDTLTRENLVAEAIRVKLRTILGIATR